MLRIFCVLCVLATVPAWAQPPTTARPTTLTQPAERPPDARRPRGRDVNLQIELTITDQLGSATPDKKVVSMLAADGTFGRIRSMAGVVNAIINVDARPQILANDQILLELTIEYGPPNREGAPARERPATLNESLTVILQNGKSQLISQASDPAADRKMSVEVRANVLK